MALMFMSAGITIREFRWNPETAMLLEAGGGEQAAAMIVAYIFTNDPK